MWKGNFVFLKIGLRLRVQGVATSFSAGLTGARKVRSEKGERESFFTAFEQSDDQPKGEAKKRKFTLMGRKFL
jgi:hypothetical protein